METPKKDAVGKSSHTSPESVPSSKGKVPRIAIFHLGQGSTISISDITLAHTDPIALNFSYVCIYIYMI